ncbi:YsnF/AvaK domain-containing protein [Tunicatimonas pelagia]|uniref:YsnF/AvaK domain-containing protein n=1 Tax=Tunicatimonas pelagia TaxID=931531 RepID=UPI002666630D|nr:YsnF/AvaK domain-containing protein [Tunicatimonas pelagia]WKN42182.1 YsnF/AvaK domain-containing protein [Tunicatimonas pelagia]
MLSKEELNTDTIPVIKEQVVIDKRSADTAKVRIAKSVNERNVQLDITEEQDTVMVERVPVGRMVEIEPTARHEGDTLTIPVLREEVVIEKKIILVEEIRVTKKKGETTRKVDVTLKEEDIDITRESLDYTNVGENKLT